MKIEFDGLRKFGLAGIIAGMIYAAREELSLVLVLSLVGIYLVYTLANVWTKNKFADRPTEEITALERDGEPQGSTPVVEGDYAGAEPENIEDLKG